MGPSSTQKSDIYFCNQDAAAAAAAAAKSLQSCPTLCDPIDGSPPGSPVPGILQARTLEWVAMSFSNAWKCKVKVKSLSRVWLRDPMDGSLQGFSVHGIFQARVLEWVAVAFSDLVDRHLFLYLLWLTRKWSWEEGKGLIFRQEGLRDKSDSS